MSSPDASGLTPESNARDIASLTQALDMVVSQFVRPSVQQANANRETLDEVIELLSRHATGLLTLEQRLEGLTDIVSDVAQQQRVNAQQTAQNAEAIAALTQRLEQFDTRLEETRQLVAKNSSDIAQISVKVDQFITEGRAARESQQTSINQLIEENRAFRETAQTQLAAIIGNARRIDRLEQQAG